MKEEHMFRIASIAVAFMATAAHAEPVYLHCQFDPALDENHRAPMNVTLNENESTVTWTFANNERVYSSKAAFLADSVAFGSSRIGNDTIGGFTIDRTNRSEEHTSELQSLMSISYAVSCLKNK